MQHRYVADTGDFGKFGLLKNLCNGKLRLGVNWYLNLNEEKHNKDGRHTAYPPSFKEADDKLHNQLQSIIQSNRRHISEIEKNKILPDDTLFYNTPFSDDCFKRDEWLEKSLTDLKDSNIIFCDPDNGLEVSTCSKYHPAKAVKYIYYDEVKEVFRKGKSLVIYQHSTRIGSPNKQAEERKSQLLKILNINADQIKIIFFNTGTVRFYLIIQQRDHKDILDSNLSALMNTPWNKIFQLK